jgi:hypothetical protein
MGKGASQEEYADSTQGNLSHAEERKKMQNPSETQG